MSLPNYQIVVLDPISAATQIIFDATIFYELRYSRALNEVGTIAMTLPSTSEIRAAFTLDSFVEVYRDDENGVLRFEETYLVRFRQRFVEDNVEKFVVGGMSLNQLLMRRVIDPDDDPLQAGGFSTKSGRADQVMHDYCNQQIGPAASTARRIVSLTLTPTTHIGTSVGQRLRHENLFTIIADLAKQGAVDFQIYRTSGNNLVLGTGTIGLDHRRSTNVPLGQPWVGLTPRRGNLTSPSLVNDRKEEANFIYALGQGQRDRRIVYKAAGAGVSDSPFNRAEFTEDIRNVKKDDVLALITGAEAALKEHVAKLEFTYQPTNDEPGNKYRVDWDLGDAVTIDWDENTLDLRIINVEISLSTEGEKIQSTVTNDFVFPGSVPFIGGLPARATLWHYTSTVLTGVAISAAVSTTETYAHLPHQNPAANGDSWTGSFEFGAGSYIFSIVSPTSPNYGKIDWYIDGVLIISGQDWYSSPAVFNVVKTATVTVVGNGYHVLKAVVNGKNALSTDFFTEAVKMWFKPAVDT